MKTIKDLLDALPKAIMEEIENEEFENPHDGFVHLVSTETGNYYNTGIAVCNIRKIKLLIKYIAKYIPENWTDKIISLDKIRKMRDIKYWIADTELFRNIIKYVNKEEYQQLIFEMISSFGLEEANQVKNSFENNDENAFCNLMLKYEDNKRYKKFVAKCGTLLLLRRALFMELTDPNLLNELSDIQKILLEIKNNSGDTGIIDCKEFLENSKIDEQEKIDYLKKNVFWGIEFLDFLNTSKVEHDLSNHFDLKSKLVVVGNHISNAAMLYAKNRNGDFTNQRSIERCPLTKNQLGELYNILSDNCYLSTETTKELFIGVFSGQDIKDGEQIIFTFKNQYSFKFLIQELYKKRNIEIKETPPCGIEIGKPSNIFFYTKGGSLRPLKFQKENDSEYSNAAIKEKKRISEIVENVKKQ